VKNIDYSLDEVKTWAKHHALLQAMDVSVSLIQSGKAESIRELLDRALNVGDNVCLAGDDFYRTDPQLPDEIIPGGLRAESIGI
jgi:hypothetical protein